MRLSSLLLCPGVVALVAPRLLLAFFIEKARSVFAIRRDRSSRWQKWQVIALLPPAAWCDATSMNLLLEAFLALGRSCCSWGCEKQREMRADHIRGRSAFCRAAGLPFSPIFGIAVCKFGLREFHGDSKDRFGLMLMVGTPRQNQVRLRNTLYQCRVAAASMLLGGARHTSPGGEFRTKRLL